MRDFSPAVVSGMYFERLSFGLVPMSILGVRIVPSFHANQHVAIGKHQENHLTIYLVGCFSCPAHPAVVISRKLWTISKPATTQSLLH